VATQFCANCLGKLEAISAHSPIARALPSAIRRPCSQTAPPSRYAGTPNWR
jgi:hypothetical protein